MMASRMQRKFHVRFRAGENLEITSKDYLSLYVYMTKSKKATLEEIIKIV